VRVGKKFDFDGVAGESGRGAVWPSGGTKGNFWNPCLELGRRLLHFFSSDRLNINGRKRKSVVLKVGLRTPNIGLRRGRFWPLRKAVPISVSAISGGSAADFSTWQYGSGQCRVHRILGPFANRLSWGWLVVVGLRDTEMMLSLRLSFTRLETRAQEFLTKCE
jgi:hypothetical protein